MGGRAAGAQEWLRIAGGFGIALAALALYGGTALALEEAQHREVLPRFRRGAAEEAFQGYDLQLERLQREPAPGSSRREG